MDKHDYSRGYTWNQRLSAWIHVMTLFVASSDSPFIPKKLRVVGSFSRWGWRKKLKSECEFWWLWKTWRYRWFDSEVDGCRWVVGTMSDWRCWCVGVLLLSPLGFEIPTNDNVYSLFCTWWSTGYSFCERKAPVIVNDARCIEQKTGGPSIGCRSEVQDSAMLLEFWVLDCSSWFMEIFNTFRTHPPAFEHVSESSTIFENAADVLVERKLLLPRIRRIARWIVNRRIVLLRQGERTEKAIQRLWRDWFGWREYARCRPCETCTALVFNCVGGISVW